MTSVGSVLREAAGAQAAVAAAVIVVVLLVVCVGAACILACSASKVFAHGVGLHSIKKACSASFAVQACPQADVCRQILSSTHVLNVVHHRNTFKASAAEKNRPDSQPHVHDGYENDGEGPECCC